VLLFNIFTVKFACSFILVLDLASHHDSVAQLYVWFCW